MPVISNLILHNFLKSCTVSFDVYDSYNNVAYLKDSMGATIARVDYDTNISYCDARLFVNDTAHFSLDKEHIQIVFEYIDAQSQEVRAYKLKMEREAYDVKFEQGIFTYCY